MSGSHVRRRDVGVHVVEEVIFTVPREAGVQVDGDALTAGTADTGGVPVTAGREGASIHVRLAPETLLVLAPPADAARPAPTAPSARRT
jgi:hypothetical protein